MKLVIDGVNFTSYCKKGKGYRVTYVKREGVNSGIMQDGSKSFDLLAFKAVLEWDLIGLTSPQIATIMTACLKQYVSVTFFDPKINADRTASMIPEVSEATAAFQRNGGTFWKDGITITMEER